MEQKDEKKCKTCGGDGWVTPADNLAVDCPDCSSPKKPEWGNLAFNFLEKCMDENQDGYLITVEPAVLREFVNSKVSLQQEEMERELPPAIGVSQWLNYGEKYGYDKFFINKWQEQIRKEIEGMEYVRPNGEPEIYFEIWDRTRRNILALLESKDL